MTIHAFTELHNDYPAFVNLSEREPGVFLLTVRSQGNGGRDVGVIQLTRERLLNLVNDAAEHLETVPLVPYAGVDIEQMVQRFLGWSLPKTFSPDCGISFDGRKDDEWNKNKPWPIGTNLFNAEEARAMFEYALQGDRPVQTDPAADDSVGYDKP